MLLKFWLRLHWLLHRGLRVRLRLHISLLRLRVGLRRLRKGLRLNGRIERLRRLRRRRDLVGHIRVGGGAWHVAGHVARGRGWPLRVGC